MDLLKQQIHFEVVNAWGTLEALTVPKFRNTGHALSYAFAHKGSIEILNNLISERKRLSIIIKNLQKLNRDDEAIYLISGQSQFLREAIEEMQKS